MSQNIGFLYGKAKVKNLSVSASSFISGINMSIGNTTSNISSGASISSQIQPSENITLNAILPPNYLGAQQYHDGSTPKEGNYYYTPSTIYTFDSWKDGNDNVISTNTMYIFSMPTNDTNITGNATQSIVETNKVYAIPITLVNNSSSYINNVYITKDGNTSSDTNSITIYIWPNASVTIGGTSKSTTTSNVQYSGCDNNNRPRSASAYMYRDTTTYYIKNIMDGTASLLSNNDPGGYSSVSVTPNVSKTYSVNGSYSVVRNSTYCNSSTTTWTNGNTNGSSTTTSSIRSTMYWFTNNANYRSGKTETYNIEIRTRSLGNSQTYATNGASSSSFRTVTSVIQGTTINGVAKGTNVISYSNRHGYATVASGTWGQTNGATTISASRRSTSSSYSTGYGANSGIAAYTGSNRSTYGTSHYMSTYPLTAESVYYNVTRMTAGTLYIGGYNSTIVTRFIRDNTGYLIMLGQNYNNNDAPILFVNSYNRGNVTYNRTYTTSKYGFNTNMVFLGSSYSMTTSTYTARAIGGGSGIYDYNNMGRMSAKSTNISSGYLNSYNQSSNRAIFENLLSSGERSDIGPMTYSEHGYVTNSSFNNISTTGTSTTTYSIGNG